MSVPERVAVFDLGSARSKLIVAERDYEQGVVFKRYKRETGSAGHVADDGTLSSDLVESLLGAVDELRSIAYESGCSRSVAVATEVFRKAPNGSAVVARLQGLLGHVILLSPQVEGGVLYSSVRRSLGEGSDLCVMDVGGGSVQVVWGLRYEEVASLRTGTYTLEREFQRGGKEPSRAEMAEMRAYIEREVERLVPENVRCRSLVFGSTCMLDFMMSVMRAIGLGESRVGADGWLRIHREDVETVLHELASQPYDAIGPYFPDNPMFMRGADKALMNVCAVAERISALSVLPTNESVGTALARLALDEPALLERIGLKVSQMA